VSDTLVAERQPAPEPRTTRRPGGASRALAVVFTLATFTSAFLLFLVQPMVAKLVLPSYGGASSVWNTAMVFFQGALLVGYLYAHLLTHRLPAKRQLGLHLVVIGLAALALPIALPSWAAPSAAQNPGVWLLLVLVVAVGGPFVALSTTGPLLQRWFSLTDHPRAGDPYFLYAASNAGSFLALLGYPVLLEPQLDVDGQTALWSVGYALFVGLLVVCVVVMRRHARPSAATAPVEAAAPVPWRRRLSWVGLAFVPSSLMLGVTSHITTDLAAAPLLWVIPLSAYLATFVVAFGRHPGRDDTKVAAVVIGLAVATTAIRGREVGAPLLFEVLLHLVLFTAIAFAMHRRLARDRPAPAQLTGFYLAIALGGVLGGIANALVAPVVFTRVLEYPIVLVAGLLLLATRIPPTMLTRRYGRFGRGLEPFVLVPALLVAAITPIEKLPVIGWLYLPLLIALTALAALRWRGMAAVGAATLLLFAALNPSDYLLASRTFFGVYRVYEERGQIVLEHGSTIHGREWLDASRRDEPIGYYAPSSPIGEVFNDLGPRLRDVALIGLGVGTLAAYGEPSRHLTFYEIDPEVIRIARDTGYFHYLADSRSPVDYVIGDGRLELAAAPPASSDLIVLDAFSSDAIPVHLITREAVAGYLDRLRAGGVLAFHISNVHLDLKPVLSGISRDLGLHGRVRVDLGDPANGALPSEWVILSRDASPLDVVATEAGWQDLAAFPAHSWTDGYSNLLSVLK
jgi:hypothetical protein